MVVFNFISLVAADGGTPGFSGFSCFAFYALMNILFAKRPDAAYINEDLEEANPYIRRQLKMLKKERKNRS